ncbi:MAG: hypothetical protein O7A98_05305, partial [Acidobacteria bacterium]|nr:hypothetical protein [Acidobacteriota bacterium]
MRRSVSYVLALLTVASLAPADTVLLTNGNRFDNVIARRNGDTVQIRFSYGEIGLPASLVRRVEKSESSLERYLQRVEVLEADRSSGAQQWLDLALDAKASGLGDGYRRALSRAAELEPGLPALADLMRGLDFVLDRQRGRWIPYAESNLAASRAQAREESRAAEAVARESRALAAERGRLLEVLEMMVIAELAEELGALRRQPPAVQVVAAPIITVWGWGGGVGGWVDTQANRHTQGEQARSEPRRRVPGGPGRADQPTNEGRAGP